MGRWGASVFSKTFLVTRYVTCNINVSNITVFVSSEIESMPYKRSDNEEIGY